MANPRHSTIEHSVTATGSTTARPLADWHADVVNAKAFGARGDGTTDDTAAIQAAIDTYTNAGASGTVFLPSGTYRITGTINLRAHVQLRGAASDTSAGGAPATEIRYYGADGGTAILTAQSDDLDWSRSSIEDVQVRAYTPGMTSGWGIRVRNPQNGSYLRNVKVMGFPTRGLLVYEPAGRVSGAGTTPGVFFTDNVYVSGGAIPVEVQAGVQPIEIRSLVIGADATSTKGAYFTRSPNSPSAAAAAITVIASSIEIPASGPDIHGWEWDADLALAFVGTSVQRDDANGANLSTKAAFHYAYASRSLPTAEFINCTSWKMRYLYQFDRAGLSPQASVRDEAQQFSWTSSRVDAVVPFFRDSITAGMTTQPVYVAGNANGGALGFIAPRPGLILGIAATYTGTVSTAAPDDLTAGVYINGTLAGTVHVSSSSSAIPVAVSATGRRDWHDFTAGSELQSWFIFAAGDHIQVKVTTGAGFLPVSEHLSAFVHVRYR